MPSPTYAGAHFFRFSPLPKLHPRGYFCGFDFAGGIYFQRSARVLAVFVAFLDRVAPHCSPIPQLRYYYLERHGDVNEGRAQWAAEQRPGKSPPKSVGVDLSFWKSKWMLPYFHVSSTIQTGLAARWALQARRRQKFGKRAVSALRLCNPVKSHKSPRDSLEILGENRLRLEMLEKKLGGEADAPGRRRAPEFQLSRAILPATGSYCST